MKKLKLHELGRISTEEYKQVDKLPVVFVLDNIRSLNNVGSAFRTADAFRVAKIYLTGITGQPPHREIQKTALGATESVDWEYCKNADDIIEQLKKEEYEILVMEQTSKSIKLGTFVPKDGTKYCLVFGNEVDGVSESILEKADQALEIPQSGTKHSLNVAVCIGITAWHFSQNRDAKNI